MDDGRSSGAGTVGGGPTEFRTDPRTGGRLLLAGAGLTALSGALVAIGVLESGAQRIVLLGVGLVGLVFFGAATVVIAARLIRRRPVVALGEDGIVLPDAGLLRWDEIAEIRVDEVRGQRFLAIVPVDVAGYLDRLSPVRRTLARLNRATGFAPISIAENSLPVSVEEFLAALRQAARRAG